MLAGTELYRRRVRRARCQEPASQPTVFRGLVNHAADAGCVKLLVALGEVIQPVCVNVAVVIEADEDTSSRVVKSSSTSTAEPTIFAVNYHSDGVATRNLGSTIGAGVIDHDHFE